MEDLDDLQKFQFFFNYCLNTVANGEELSDDIMQDGIDLIIDKFNKADAFDTILNVLKASDTEGEFIDKLKEIVKIEQDIVEKEVC